MYATWLTCELLLKDYGLVVAENWVLQRNTLSALSAASI
jgi:hypothetical protein